MRIGWCLAAALAAVVVGRAAAAAPLNRFNDELRKLPPAEQAAKLAEVVDHWCIGTEAYFMGIARSGPEAGYAYWSVRCLDGSAYAVQFDPLGEGVVIDCETLAERGQGRACFRKF
jgi:hypothetical protein